MPRIICDKTDSTAGSDGIQDEHWQKKTIITVLHTHRNTTYLSICQDRYKIDCNVVV